MNKVHGVVEVNLTLGSYNFIHKMLVADINEEVIIGMELMNFSGFQINFTRRTLPEGYEELILHEKTNHPLIGLSMKYRFLLLAENASILD